MTTTRNTVRVLSAALALTAIAGFAIAQPAARGQGRGQGMGQGQRQCDGECVGQGKGLLRGPAVTDTNVPGAQNTFARRPMAEPADRPEDRPISMLAFVRTVQSLDAPGVDPEFNLNEGQRAVIEVMQREYDDTLALWRDENKAQLRELRSSRRPGDKPRGRRAASSPARGEKPARASQPMDRRFRQGEQAQRLDARAPGRGQGRQQLDNNTKSQRKAIMQSRPSPERQQSQIWDILTPEQRSYVETELERRRAGHLAKREMMRQRQRRNDAQQQVEN